MEATEIIERIKREAENKGISRYRIARTIGSADSQVKRWFEGENFPNLEKLVQLAHAVGFEIELKPLQ